jgi:hypothetical protein
VWQKAGSLAPRIPEKMDVGKVRGPCVLFPNVKPTRPAVALFTTENMEFTEKKKHKGLSDSSVCSLDSVVKSVARLFQTPGD